ncbi:portal protein [Streptomyces phage Cumberbatch]|uniref:Portal protein n=1 Tax=Streptomyces phage Cumberbatch TaxID=2736271 RepID=A0A6M9Z4H7_9CAUD|nr:portal protein [Streptomyces phage Cumberbatch]YP_010756473.1 portal protein [Streptomyces phage Piccadilly]QKN87646.1 portal protein [Streptomyces phage Cumberbatch]UJQ86016.1 portal protein [Streptomyces phage Piccadilly]
MSMPANGSPWPPPQMAAAYREMARDAMWYEGDPERLARAADQREHTPRRADQDSRTGRRTRWGRQPADYPRKRERRLHVPLPGDIATTAADLLFADMPAITTPDEATTTYLAEAIDTAHMHSLLLGAAEQASAMSGIFLRLTWDRDVVPDGPIPTTVQPDNAVPEYAFGIMTAVTFWRELDGDTQTVYRHLERHEPGRIVHALYEGTPDNLGRAVPLTEHADTAALVDSLGEDGVSVETGIRMLTAVYVPNMTPNRVHRSSPMGRSDYSAPIHDQFAALDDTWSSWMRDIRLARARLVVPDGYLTNLGPGAGAAFDDDREVYSSLNMPPTEGQGITLSQFAIRVEEHQRTAEAITRKAVESAGYSAQSFGLEGGGEAITATEVDSRDARSMVTTKKKSGHWRSGLSDFLLAYQLLAVAQFGARIVPARPTVEFRLDAAESEQSKATTLDLLARAGAISTRTKVKYRSPDLADEAVDAEVAAILRETGAAAPDPGDTYPM